MSETDKRILVTRSSMPPFNEFCEEIRELWDSHWLTNMGAKHKAFQCDLERYLNCAHVTLYTNGHLALENILCAMDFPKGGEVITTPFTFASTTHAIVRSELKPVFCDIRPDNYTMDADRIKELVTERTVAILPVHVYGNICDVDRIDGIAQMYGLKVIYDAAHAFAVRYKGESVANFGDASMFSFHATKVFNTIEGGAVCYNDDGLVRKLNDLKNFGIHADDDVIYAGGNAKMNEFQAAMGICNLRHIDDEISQRRKVYNRYMERLDGIEGITIHRQDEYISPNYAYFPVLFDGYAAGRDDIYNMLRNEDIYSRKYFYPLTSDFMCYRDLSWITHGDTPVADMVSQDVLTLPIYSGLSVEIVDHICDIILSMRN